MGVREVELELSSGLMPEDVELVEMAGEIRAGADVDAVIIVERDGFYAPVTDGDPVLIGEPTEVIRRCRRCSHAHAHSRSRAAHATSSASRAPRSMSRSIASRRVSPGASSASTSSRSASIATASCRCSSIACGR